MPLISSANIACGLHAGDVDSMQRSGRARTRPRRRDRRASVVSGSRAFRTTRDAAWRRASFTSASSRRSSRWPASLRNTGTRLRHVKPHGALYNMAARDEELAEAVVTCDSQRRSGADAVRSGRLGAGDGGGAPRTARRQRGVRGSRLSIGREPAAAESAGQRACRMRRSSRRARSRWCRTGAVIAVDGSRVSILSTRSACMEIRPEPPRWRRMRIPRTRSVAAGAGIRVVAP